MKLSAILLMVVVSVLNWTNSFVSTTYYVSTTDGNDSYTTTQAQNPATPWATIAHANAAAGAGTQINFKRGDTFYGGIVVPGAGTQYGSYSTGKAPIISGFTTISGWTNEGGGIYSKVITSDAEPKMVTIDGMQYAMGKLPNGVSTWSTFTNRKDSLVSGDTLKVSITGLGGSPNWTGADLGIRKNDFTAERCLIVRHVVDTLWLINKAVTSNYAGFVISGYGCFIENDVRTLTTYGEWYYSPSTGKFSMYFGAVDPNTKTVNVSTKSCLLYNNGFSSVSVQNLYFTGSSDTCISFLGTTNSSTIKNDTINLCGNWGIKIASGSGSLIDSNVISNTNATAISDDGTSTVITHNKISGVGAFLCQTKGSNYDGIYFQGKGCLVQYNSVQNTAYNNFSGKRTGNWTVQYNRGDSACAQLDDGGSIYTSGWTSGTTGTRIIDHNIFTNIIGNNSGSNNSTNFSAGIYLDEVTRYTTVTNNTVSGSGYMGVKFHKSPDNTLTDNVLYDNAYAQFGYVDDAGTVDSTITRRNTFFSKTSTQLAVYAYSGTDQAFAVAHPSLYGPSDSNIIARPIDDNLSMWYKYPFSPYDHPISLANWKTYSGQDAHTAGAPKTIASTSELTFQYNATSSPVVYSFAGYRKMLPNGTNVNNTITIPAYSSVILMDNGYSSVDFYFDATLGSDANPGTILSPKQTISAINTIASTAGNNIHLKRGETWYGGLIVGANTVTFSAYGTGVKPIITGFTTISSGWTNEGGGIYSKVISSAAQTNMVTIDGAQYAMGRYPDSSAGYLTYQTFSTNTSITSSSLTGTPNYTGSEVVIRKNDFSIDRCNVTSQSGGTLNYTSLGTTQSGTNGNGFFLQNGLQFVTTYGEWFHDYSGTGKLYVYFGGGGTAGHTVKVATINNVIYSNGYDNVSIDSLAITGSILDAINYQYAHDNCTISNCDISFAGRGGWSILSIGNNDVFTNNTVAWCNNYGVVASDNYSTTITQNNIHDIGNVLGQWLGNEAGVGIKTGATNGAVTITYNYVHSIGGHGVYPDRHGKAIVTNNRIDSIGTQYDDVGGIYTNGTATALPRYFANNIISNVLGNVAGKNNSIQFSNGIYLDETTKYITVNKNTIFNVSNSGIKLHKANSTYINGNTVYNATNALEYLDYVGNQLRNDTVRSNIFFAKTSTQNVVNAYEGASNSIALYGLADSNFYCRPIADNTNFSVRTSTISQTNYNLAQWKTATTVESHSVGAPKTIASTSELTFDYNATSSPKIISLPSYYYKKVDGTTVSGTYTIAPYESVVLTRDSLVPVLNSVLLYMYLR